MERIVDVRQIVRKNSASEIAVQRQLLVHSQNSAP
jgi:hypothetical protein